MLILRRGTQNRYEVVTRRLTAAGYRKTRFKVQPITTALPLDNHKLFHPRSEKVDFQRGEVEWRGENLYFDQWNYLMDVHYIEN